MRSCWRGSESSVVAMVSMDDRFGFGVLSTSLVDRLENVEW